MLFDKNITELTNMLHNEETSSTELCKEHLDRIKKINGKLNSYITIDEERTLSEAAESDKRRSSGKKLSIYDGIPAAIKDNICTKGMKTTCGSRILENFVAPFDELADKIGSLVGRNGTAHANDDRFHGRSGSCYSSMSSRWLAERSARMIARNPASTSSIEPVRV